jgi:hypothetical protein
LHLWHGRDGLGYAFSDVLVVQDENWEDQVVLRQNALLDEAPAELGTPIPSQPDLRKFSE